MATKQGAAALSIASNSSLVILKLIVGIVSGSVSIISEAAHSATDLAASLMAFFSVRAADLPADAEHPFGHGKIENLSGVVEAALIFLAAIYIVYESLTRLLNPHKLVIEPTLGIVVMAFSVIVNTIVSRLLFKVARETGSVAIEADGHHLSTDVWTSIGVLTGLILIKITGKMIIDPIIALVVAILILRVSLRLTREAGAPLVDVRLPRQEVDLISDIVLSEPQIIGFHKLRTRRAGTERQIDLHIIVPQQLTIFEAHDLAEKMEDRIRTALGGANVVTHVEPDTEENLRDSPSEGLAED